MSDFRAAIRLILIGDSSLLAELPGEAHVIAEYSANDAEIPVISIEHAGDDDSPEHAPDHRQTYEISVWDVDVERIDRICERIRWLLHKKPLEGMHALWLALESGEEYLGDVDDVDAYVRTQQYLAVVKGE